MEETGKEQRGVFLRAEQLRKTFSLSRKQQQIEKTQEKRKVALDGLSFNVCRGEIYGLLGPNGAGKTTALRIIATLIRPDSGDVFIDAVSVLKDPCAARKKLGFLTGELKLEDFFTPSYLYDFFSEMHGVPAQTRAERKARLFKKFGIDRFAEVKVGDLSTGMKQKVSLVISLVHDPEIIIFDEPTNGLDVLTAKVVTDFLEELKTEGKTVILSTHIFSLAEKLCDRIGIIIDGRMMRDGSLGEITGGRDLEDVFFELYRQTAGGERI